MFVSLEMLASSQHGVVTRSQILSFVSDRQLQRMLEKSILLRCHPSVYRFVAAPTTWEQQLFAATSSIAGSAASHKSAARLWGLTTVKSHQAEIVTPAACHFQRTGITLHRSTQLAGHVTTINGIATTTLPRTLVDLSGQLPLGGLARALDQAIHMRLTTIPSIHACLDDMTTKGRSRVKRLRLLLAERDDNDAKLESRLEKRTLRWIREACIQGGKVQHWVSTHRARYRMDLAFPALKVNVETDGPHHLQPVHAEEDRSRDADLLSHGWLVIRCLQSTDRYGFIASLSEILAFRSSDGMPSTA